MHKRSNHLAQQTLALPETQADLVRYDKNLLLTGFFSAHDPRHTKDAPGESVRRVEAWITENGRRKLRAVEFRSGAGTTLPTTVDRDKYMALLKIMQDGAPGDSATRERRALSSWSRDPLPERNLEVDGESRLVAQVSPWQCSFMATSIALGISLPFHQGLSQTAF